MTGCFFVSDLHGSIGRYQKLFDLILREEPAAVFLGGDLLPSGFPAARSGGLSAAEFIPEVMEAGFQSVKTKLAGRYPRVFLILGNDDPRVLERDLLRGESILLWEYLHDRSADFLDYTVYGYAYVPPTPFLLKDWERYDVSRFVDVGCVSPEDGWRTMPVEANVVEFATIDADLERLTAGKDLSRSIFLFHAPPYRTDLDRAALDGKSIDHAPVDVHIGSIALKRFIELRQPRITLHGHVHESARLTGAWQSRIGRTYAFSAATEGEALALVRFDPACPERAGRELLAADAVRESS
jgi:Icc-related predicted phosphoesterase